LIRSTHDSDALDYSEFKLSHLLSLDQFNNPESWSLLKFKISELKNKRLLLHNDLKKNEVFSNPSVDITEIDGYNIYWGDIHGHTHHSDGLGTIDEYYEFAKQVSFLDFSSITDHDDIGPRLTEDEWNMMEKGAKKHNTPHKFITLLGHEYRNGKCDMNIYYPGESGNGNL
jgi:hypothetical protein